MEKKKRTKKYSKENLLTAIEDLSIEVNNAFFRTPYNRCPECNKQSINRVMAHFDGNKIGNLKGFQATIGDLITWYSDSYKGIDFVVSKSNGVFEVETHTFKNARKEPAIIEKMIVPSKYMEIAEEMAMFLAYPFVDDIDSLTTIGNGKYPNDIKEKL